MKNMDNSATGGKVCPTCGATMSADCDTEELAEAPKKVSHFQRAKALIKDRNRKRKQQPEY